MSAEGSSGTATIDRRAALKKIGTATAGTASAITLGGFAKKEIEVIEKGLETPYATFFPLYERHDVGIDAKDLPPNLDGFFREGAPASAYAGQPANFFKDEHRGMNPTSEGTPNIKPAVLEVFAKSNTKIIYGDVYEEKLINEAYRNGLIRMGAAGVAVCAGWISHNLMGMKTSEQKVSRLKFLKRSLLGTGAVLAVPFVGTAVTLSASWNMDQKNAIQRIAIRMSGLSQNSAPESHTIFFRNLVMADKMLSLAEHFKSQSGKKPRMAFNLGAGHAGIEDLLTAGPDFIRTMISFYPKDFLESFVKANGGLEDFSSSRVLTLPNDFTAASLNSDNPNVGITDEKFADQKLLTMLENKLGYKRGETLEQAEYREKSLRIIEDTFRRHGTRQSNAQIDALLEKLKTLPFKEYEKFVSFQHFENDAFSGDNVYVNLSGNDYFSEDLLLESHRDKSTSKVRERISLYLDPEGNISPRWWDLRTVCVITDQLRPSLRSVFANVPEKDEDWTFTPAGGSGTPLAAQAYYRTTILETRQGKTQFQASQDGRMEKQVF